MKKALEFFPRGEAIVRNIYWRTPVLQSLAARKPRRHRLPPHGKQGFSITDLITTLRGMGVNSDDYVIAHSSMRNLGDCGLGPREIIDQFMGALCPHGALVCPTFPRYEGEPQGKARITKDMSSVEFTYDVEKTNPWTGELGRVLMNLTGARRSLHPLNTVAAYGPSMENIFLHERIDALDLPCGPNSTWAALAALNAKIVMLGVDLTHSLTMIHVAEDCHEEDWPIAGWYRSRKFFVVHGGMGVHVTVRERHPRWALSYAERKLSRDLYSHGIAKRAQVGSLSVTVLESTALLEFLAARRASGYPYYLTWLSRI